MYNILIVKKLLALSIPVLLLGLMPASVFAAEPSAGSVNNWFSLRTARTLSVDITPIYGEDGYHFYSLSPFFDGKTSGLYSGIQTNGNFGDGIEAGNLYVFSVWDATAAYPANGAKTVPFSTEGSGYSLRIKYDWSIGTSYKITIKRESYDSVNRGYRWSSTITNLTSRKSLKLGEITAPPGASTLRSGSAFHERYAGITPLCTNTNSNLEKAGVRFSNITADKPIAFHGTPQPNNIFASANCMPYIQTVSDSKTATSVFGHNPSHFVRGQPVTINPIFSPCMCHTNRIGR